MSTRYHLPPMSLNNKDWVFRAAFFVGCPLLLSLPLGLFQAGFAQHLTLEVSVLFWAVAWISAWWMSEVLLRILHTLLRPWNVALIAEIALASILNIAAYSFYFPPVMFLFADQATQLPPEYFADRAVPNSIEYVLVLVRSGLAGLIAWVSLRSLYAMLPDRLLGTESGRQVAEAKMENLIPGDLISRLQSQPMSKFRGQLVSRKVGSLDKVIALQASDHYVSVYLDDGRVEFIFSRFSDAVNELAAQDGLRIHRSFWIKRSALQEIERNGFKMTVRLTNGLSCPISIKYQGYFEHFLAQPNARLPTN